MRRLTTLAFALAATLAPAATTGAQSRGPRLVVEARLVAAPPDMIRCGRLHAVYVLRYQVVRVVRGRYQGAQIYVVHSCPELVPAGHGRGLRIGATYRLGLSSRRPRLWPAPIDTLGQQELPRWHAVQVRWLSG